MKKRFTRAAAGLLAVLLLLGILPTAQAQVSYTYTVGNTEYSLLFDSISFNGGYSDDGIYSSTWFYSDGYFSCDPKVYDAHIASCSQILSLTACNGGADTSCDALLGKMGYSDLQLYDIVSDDGFPTGLIDYVISKKELADVNGAKTGKVVISVLLRGDDYSSIWAYSGLIGSSGNAIGFEAMATQITENLTKYVDDRSLSEEYQKGNVLFWVTGSSLGATAAQLAAQKIIAINTQNQLSDKVFCYTFGSQAASASNDPACTAIQNLYSDCDILSWLHSTLYGFQRVGTNIEISDYVYCDTWKQQLDRIDPGNNCPSQLQAAYCTLDITDTLHLIKTALSDGIDIENALVPAAGVSLTVPQFGQDLIRNLTTDHECKWIGTRANFCTETFGLGQIPGSADVTLESGIFRFLSIYLGLSEEQQDTLIELFSNVGETISDYCNEGNLWDKGEHYAEVAGYADTLCNWLSASNNNKQEVLWFLAQELMSTYVAENSQTYTLQTLLGDKTGSFLQAFPVVMNALLRVFMRDYNMQYPGGCQVQVPGRLFLLGTMIYDLTKGSRTLLAARDGAFMMAAVQSVDSFYLSTFTYGTPTYVWNGAGCTAVCSLTEAAGIKMYEQAAIDYVKDTDAACLSPETGHYRAAFTQTAFAEQHSTADSVVNGTAAGHGDWVYSASGAVLTATCGHGTCGHTETAALTVEEGPFVYSGEAYTPVTIVYSEHFPVQTLQVSCTDNINAGTASASVTCSGVTASLAFTIDRAVLQRPVYPKDGAEDRVYTWSGEVQTFLPDGFDPDTMTISGNEQTAANESGYTVTVTPRANYRWETEDVCSFRWVIGRGNAPETLREASGFLEAEEGSTAEISLPELPEGASYGLASLGDLAGVSAAVTEGKLELNVTDRLSKNVTEFTVLIPVSGCADYLDYSVTATVSVMHQSVTIGQVSVEGGKLTVRAATNLSAAATVDFMAVCYDAHGMMLGCLAATKSFSGSSAVIELGCPADITTSEGVSWRVFALEHGGFNPLCPAAER